MANAQIQSSNLRRWPLVIALSLGVLGGAAADAVVTLRQASSAAGQAAVAALHSTAVKNLPAATAGTAVPVDAAVQEAASACSCVDGAEVAAERSPLAPRRKHGRPSGHAVPVRTSLCAAAAVLQQ
jgi:hypothetical protein